MKTHTDGTVPEDGEIFVFGSNLAGRHGRGAAYAAVKKYGAVYGVGVGKSGNSYAIPTKNEFVITMDIFTISAYVNEFIAFVENHPHLDFFLTRIGCGLAGYKDSQIAPLFKKLKNFDNVSWPEDWVEYLH